MTTCGKCNASRELDRLPKGWHHHGEGTLCDKCWKSSFILRAVTFPVVGPVAGPGEGPGEGTWAELREVLTQCWSESQSLANWGVTELAKRDTPRKPSDKKYKKPTRVRLYPIAVKHYPNWRHWEGSTQSADTLLRAVEQKYYAAHYKTMWTHEQSLLSFRYPFPYPIRASAWTAKTINQRPTVTLPLLGGRWTLRLKGGPEMARQLAAFRQLERGEAIKCEAALYRVRGNVGDHRNGVSETNHTVARQHGRVMLKLVAWIPRKERGPASATMLVRTDPNAFIVAEIAGQRPWILNGDIAKRWHAAHRVYLQRIAEDTKFEKRWSPRKREQINAARDHRCKKNTNRITTFIYQSVAMLVGYALRQGVCEVVFDDKCRDYLPAFPWADVKKRLKEKLNEASVTLTAA